MEDYETILKNIQYDPNKMNRDWIKLMSETIYKNKRKKQLAAIKLVAFSILLVEVLIVLGVLIANWILTLA